MCPCNILFCRSLKKYVIYRGPYPITHWIAWSSSCNMLYSIALLSWFVFHCCLWAASCCQGACEPEVGSLILHSVSRTGADSMVLRITLSSTVLILLLLLLFYLSQYTQFLIIQFLKEIGRCLEVLHCSGRISQKDCKCNDLKLLCFKGWVGYLYIWSTVNSWFIISYNIWYVQVNCS